MHIVAMRTDDGNALVSKGRFQAEKGEQCSIKATVKTPNTTASYRPQYSE
jgi:hypothetical protein